MIDNTITCSEEQSEALRLPEATSGRRSGASDMLHDKAMSHAEVMLLLSGELDRSSTAWDMKVSEIAGRGITVKELLHFYSSWVAKLENHSKTARVMLGCF